MELPPLEEFPAGPRRAMLESLHALYRAAGTPGVRTISEGLAQGDFRATMNRDLVSKVLSGRRWPTAWQLDSLVRWLAVRAIEVQDPEAEASRFLWLYQQAAAEQDGTLRSAGPTRSSIVVRSEHQSGMGVLLADGSVLTRAYLLGDGPALATQSLGVGPIDSGPTRAANVMWHDPDPSGFALLTPNQPMTGAAGANWGAPPPHGAGVRIYGPRRNYGSSGAETGGLWLAGTTMGPSGAVGDWQLDMAVPEYRSEDRNNLLRRLGGAGVLDDSGRVVGVVSYVMSGTSFVWMTSFDSVTAQVPAATRF